MTAGPSDGLFQRRDPWEKLWYSPGAGPAGLRLALSPLSALFAAAVAARTALYDRGFLEVGRAEAPVVSVGGLRVGGAGKTPFVAWLARQLREDGLSPCIVTRGYGRDDSPERSRRLGEEPFLVDEAAVATPAMVAAAGDEAVLLARRSRVPVVVGADRVRACAAAVKGLGRAPDVFLLDDGFQHRGLARDLDIVLVAGTEEGERLLPAGPLREPVTALGRADVVVEVAPAAGRGRAGEGPGVARRRLRARCVVSALVDRVDDEAGADPSSLAGRSVVAVAAIARPERFLADLRATGARVVATVLRRDHHRFDESDRRILEAEAAGADLVVTTEKDLVKLEHLDLTVPVRALRIDLVFEEPADQQALLARVRAAFDR